MSNLLARVPYSPNLWVVGAGVAALYILGLVLYRLILSPLAKFPGPKLAAATLWYEFYFDVVKKGQYTFEIGRMHDKYGPIVRISPHELHIRDPDFYEVLYTGPGVKRDKYLWATKLFGNAPSMLGTVNHEHHRLRRAPLSPFFSKRSVANLEPMIRGRVERMAERLTDAQKDGSVVNLGHMYAALTMDIITEYSYAKSYNCLDAPDFMRQWPDTIDAVSRASHLNKQFPWLLGIFQSMPRWMVAAMDPDMVRLIDFQDDLARSITKVKEAGPDKPPESPTIFHDLLFGDLPPEEKTLTRLVAEGQTVIAAGQVTTADYLKKISYHIIANPDILTRLRAELATIMQNSHVLPTLQQLEQLSYLNAVMNEGFRISYGVTSRLQRVSPDSDLQFREWTIPAGTPVGMTSIFMHDDSENFPSPHEFKPDRWTQPGSKNLERYLVNFSKGTRACLGQNLARAEIYLVIAAVFSQFDLALFETTREDADVAHDFFNPQPVQWSKGVRATVVQGTGSR